MTVLFLNLMIIRYFAQNDYFFVIKILVMNLLNLVEQHSYEKNVIVSSKNTELHKMLFVLIVDIQNAIGRKLLIKQCTMS